ncbi:potassium-transporting ATPase subunit KdpC [Candidatus Bipolaricaulota bacterium]|nr:potassium-transporting ATPase subunit KdpC [Candidatus Bipolaricaulota bacterium]
MVDENGEDKQEERPEGKEEMEEGEKEMAEGQGEEVPEEEVDEVKDEGEHPPAATDKTVEEESGEGEPEEKEVKEEEEIEEEEEVSYPDTDELGVSRMLTTGLRMLIISILLTSVLYVLATTGIGNLVWPGSAQGNLVKLDGEVVGSKLIGQSFSSDKYFHPRPSSKNYDGMDSGSANLSPENEKLTQRAKDLLEELEEEGVNPKEVPVSFVTESGSALDPHIVPESAYLQVPRVSEATGMDPERLRELIDENIQGKFLGLYGQKRVNVLTLNMEIEKILETG